MHPETDVIHRSEGVRDGATPLTTPIYATSTFVFASAAELEQYQQGKTNKYIYSRYANPSVQSVEEKLAAATPSTSRMGMAAPTVRWSDSASASSRQPRVPRK